MNQVRKDPTVLLLSNYPPPFGGVPTVVKDLTDYLIERGWKVIIIAPGFAGEPIYSSMCRVIRETRAKPRRLFDALRFLLHARPAAALSSVRSLLSTRLFWGDHLQRVTLAHAALRRSPPDLIVAYNLYATGPAAMLLQRHFHAPTMLFLYGEILTFPCFFRKHSRAFRHVASSFQRILSMSAHCACTLRALGIHQRVEVFDQGRDLSKFEQMTTIEARKENRIPDLSLEVSDFVVLYFARMEREMGLDIFVAAARKLLLEENGFRFLICGKRGAETRGVLALQEEYPHKVTIICDIAEEVLPSVYSACNVLVAPTAGDRACGSMAAIEAMAASRAVVATRVGGIPEIVIHGQTGILVDRGDVDAIANAVRGLAKDPDACTRIGRMGRKHVKEKYDVTITNRHLESIFRDAIEEHSRKGVHS